MTRTCSVCTHPERPAIDQALIAGAGVREVASRYVPITRSAVQRHKQDHLPPLLAKAKEAQAVADADDLLAQAKALRTKALSLLLKAEGMGDFRTALAGIREARSCLELLGKLQGQLQDGANINIVIAPAWIEVRAQVIAALEPYPEARAAVASQLRLVEVGHDHVA